MQITEIYRSLQGESTYAGLACVFVRLTGCNLRCSWCDSEYTFHGGRKMTEDQVLNEVRGLSPNGGLVEITGGEPLLQERELLPLIEKLLPQVWSGMSAIASSISPAEKNTLERLLKKLLFAFEADAKNGK